MITAKDIHISHRHNHSEYRLEILAEVHLRGMATVSEQQQIVSRGMSVEHLEQRLKKEILNKLYGDIRFKLAEALYDAKQMVMDWGMQHVSPLQTVDQIDRVFRSVADLIDEKMKVD